jgi:RNA polymerase sigma-70 factor (ECF subfamily)
MDDPCAAFVAELSEEVRARFPEGELRAALEKLPVDPAELARRFKPTDLADLATCRADDIALAILACRGDAGAIAEIKRLLDREVELTALRTSATPEQANDVKGELGRILFGGALHDFAGRAALKSYISVIATRELVKTVQRGRRESPVADEQLFAMLSNLDDPELEVLRGRFHESVAVGLRAALAKLADRDRALLRYQLVDGWNVDRVGALYGVHRATAARWVAAARETLGQLLRDEIATTLSIPITEVDSIVRLVQSRIDVSLARLISD